MDTAIDAIDYLTRSPSRITVLERIHESAQSRRELKDAVEASRTTLSRMLAEFEDRNWITRSDNQYQTTAKGDLIAFEVRRVLQNVDAGRELSAQLEWLPIDDFDFDLHRLHDAEVFTLRWNDPASIRRLAGTLDGANEVKSVAAAISREVVDILRNVIVDQSATYEGIIGPEALQIIQDHPELREQLHEIIGAENATVYEYRGGEPLTMVMVVDEMGTICNHNTESPEMEALLSEDRAFRAWCESYFNSLRADAEPLTSSAFAR